MVSKTREKVYNFLIEYIKEYGYAPSVRDICEGVGLKSTSSVYSHLSKLEEEGKIETRGHSPRAIKIMGYGYMKLDEKHYDGTGQMKMEKERDEAECNK